MDLYSRSSMFPMMHYATNDNEQLLQQHLHGQSQLSQQKDAFAANFSNFPLVAAAASLNGTNNTSTNQAATGTAAVLGSMEGYQMNQLHHNS
ncbi:unnamed protein product [Bursaphelenchus okinawaensis]|uniref:Uncharacterized protein n=1 Tax=Bursaphelenchus okinawaensis TaxID=465554 RepID=A0A811K6H9_9BILA|nr:unnamed protein product [Bursaphelenchus okinawaensis]CAG9093321.1 unnamed protein product [Bursaphelenchus okinawaensis]